MIRQVVFVVASASILTACSGKHAATSAPSCASLVGKTPPTSIADTGCKVGDTTRAVASFTCKDGSTLVTFPGEQNEAAYWWHEPTGVMQTGTYAQVTAAQDC